ncbi:MAG: 16S rRNA (uracil(1498)-N(3))-methyltransferase [Nocardioidaceae bacterium]
MSAPVFLAAAEALTGDPIDEATGPADARAADAGAGEGGTVVLDGPEGRHAAVVRRLRPGERVDLTDGRGRLAHCVVAEVSGARLVCRVQHRQVVPAPSPRLVVVQALPKGDRAELAVEMLTEIGVDVIVPWAASRSVVHWRGARAAKSLAKWRSHAREATKQSRRAWLPEVRELADTTEVSRLLAQSVLPLVLHEEGGQVVPGLEVPDHGEIVVVVGPEGGLSDDELSAFTAVVAQPLRLGRSVLRTSTAGVAAAAAVLSRTGRWG